MWILWQIAATFAITGYITVMNYFSEQSFIKGYLYFCLAVAVLGWIVPIAYTKAPSFIQAYIIQNGLLPVTGVLVDLLFFKESTTFIHLHYIGIILITSGTLLMVK